VSEARIYIGVASSGHCRTAFAVHLAQLVSYFQSEALAPEVTKQQLTVDCVMSSGIAHNYHQLVLRAREWGATHMLTLEDDMGFSPHVLHMLYRRHQLWVGANYPARSLDPYWFTSLKASKDGRVYTGPKSTGLERAHYTGFGVTLFDMELFNKLEQPWFLMAWLGDGNYATQDAWLGEQAAKAGVPVYVDHDVSKLVHHIGDHNFRWEECVAYLDAKAKREAVTDGK
jgi:hypothetical protein